MPPSSRIAGLSGLLLSGRLRLNSDVLRVSDGVWRAGRRGYAGGRHCEYEEFSPGLTNGVEMVAVVPEELTNRALREQAGIVSDRAAPVEVEDLQPRRSANRQQFA